MATESKRWVIGGELVGSLAIERDTALVNSFVQPLQRVPWNPSVNVAPQTHRVIGS